MCGFAGVIAWDEKYRVSHDTLRKMAAAVAHRGPDGEGFYLNHEDGPTPDRPQVGLAFRRLAILDPDPRSDQPFTDGRRTMVFNGEIYNFRELRSELSKDHDFKTTGDTEVLLAAYATWGQKCVDRLNGMFAFAVWDSAEKTLFLARDRMGQKPLYWAARRMDGSRWDGLVEPKSDIDPPFAVIAFGSELASLMALDWLGREIDLESLTAYLRFGYVPAPRTSILGVRNFFPSLAGVVRHDFASARTYFNRGGFSVREPSIPRPSTARVSELLEEVVTNGGTRDAVTTTRDFVQRAVHRQLVSDVPIGCLLSGGMDSSIIAAAMKTGESNGKIHTFGFGFDDPRYDESAYAEAVARHLGTEHHRCSVNYDVAADLPKLATAFGDPFADSSAIPTFYLSREVRSSVKVALGGDGGDELFGGYDRYRAMHIAAALDRTTGMFRRAISAPIWQRLPGTHPKSRGVKLKRFLATVNSKPIDRYAQIMSIFSADQVSSLLANPAWTEHRSAGWPLDMRRFELLADQRGAAQWRSR